MSDHYHDGDYAPIGHQHQVDEIAGAADNIHDHDRDYPHIHHDHDRDYALADHNHNDRIDELEKDMRALIRRVRELDERLASVVGLVGRQAEQIDRLAGVLVDQADDTEGDPASGERP